MSVAHVRTSHVCRARTSFTVQRSLPIFAEVKSLGYPREISRSTCALYVSANAGWCRTGMTSILKSIRRAERNSFSGRVGSSGPEQLKPYFLMEQHVSSVEEM